MPLAAEGGERAVRVLRALRSRKAGSTVRIVRGCRAQSDSRPLGELRDRAAGIMGPALPGKCRICGQNIRTRCADQLTMTPAAASSGTFPEEHGAQAQRWSQSSRSRQPTRSAPSSPRLRFPHRSPRTQCSQTNNLPRCAAQLQGFIAAGSRSRHGGQTARRADARPGQTARSAPPLDPPRRLAQPLAHRRRHLRLEGLAHPLVIGVEPSGLVGR